MAGTTFIMTRSAWVSSFSNPKNLADTIRGGYFGEHLDAVIAALKEANQVPWGSANLQNMIEFYNNTSPNKRFAVAEAIAIHLELSAKILAPVVARASDTFLGTRRFEDSKELSAKVAAALKSSDPVSAKVDPKIREDFDKAISDLQAVIVASNAFLPRMSHPGLPLLDEEVRKTSALIRLENHAKTHPEFFDREQVILLRYTVMLEILGETGFSLSVGILEILRKPRPDLFPLSLDEKPAASDTPNP